MLASDVILLTSPVYALHVGGPMKTFLDHYCGMWMVHKPNREMFHKRGLVIAAASGPVYRAALREMKDSLDFWGVARTWKMGFPRPSQPCSRHHAASEAFGQTCLWNSRMA